MMMQLEIMLYLKYQILDVEIIENHIPPFGEIHFLPDLPLPPVCFSEIIIDTLIFLTRVTIFNA